MLPAPSTVLPSYTLVADSVRVLRVMAAVVLPVPATL